MKSERVESSKDPLVNNAEDELKTCIATYFLEKPNMKQEIEQCMRKTSPDGREKCIKDRIDRYLALKEKRDKCGEKAMSTLFKKVLERDIERAQHADKSHHTLQKRSEP